ncbi:uncharacterized protein PFL1_02469 [Pseudozyma flocculosa PF-1]|uniref:Related to dehydrogenase n=2 Tax=Pseudozyma flocculosa TaxID=84751 RepID=A0A5C3EZN5_9BASI|nr:uncharacterized protein PFL1_02469 [Pseudozyma flocculosa PF-1]EPQ29796.1 hypothetical protein PFL1_02469 [Pseudozyma flocculosa PF-1]SPO37086.1 related to dehydrogenase [Pseudozyma flocculosa]
MASPAKFRVAAIGVGRQGKVHALNFAFSTPKADLVAVVDPNEAAQDWARANLPAATKVFGGVEELYAHFGCQRGAPPGSAGLDAACISTETSYHAALCVQAIDFGLHVLLEKPVSIDIEGHVQVVEAAKRRPDVRVLVALSRRFDPTYRNARQRVKAGQMGDVHLIRSATVDQYDDRGWFVPYSLKSGGIFVDCAIHDIDIARWFLGLSNAQGEVPRSRPYRVTASGYNARHPELAQYGDADNALGTVLLEDGRSFYFHLGRTAVHGHECVAEIYGTQGRLVVNANPRLDRLDILDSHGVRSESTPSYWERFKDAFVVEAREFVDCCLDPSLPLPVTLEDAFEAARIATALTISLRSGQPVYFDDKGDPIRPKGWDGTSCKIPSKDDGYVNTAKL